MTTLIHIRQSITGEGEKCLMIFPPGAIFTTLYLFGTYETAVFLKWQAFLTQCNVTL
jgi:hypothetical protein